MGKQYKHLLNFFSNLFILVFQGTLFAMLWYLKYRDTIIAPLYRRGNWAVISIYIFIVFFFTQVFRGYKVGYMRAMDIIVSHILAIIMSTVCAYLLIVLVGRKYVDIRPLVVLMIIQICVIIPWIVFIRYVYKKLYPPRKILLVYGNHEPTEMLRKINSRTDRYNVCETICCSDENIELYERINKREGVVLFDLPSVDRNRILKYCYEKGIRVYVTPKISDIIMTSAEDIHLFDTPLLIARNEGLSIEQRFLKRLMDIITSFCGIIIFSPILILVSLAVKCYDGGPILYKQCRLTKDNKEFWIYKFRSMCVDSEKKGARLAAKNDNRITQVGKVIRRLHVDELPQLFNILKGDMAFVGPRPERPEIRDHYIKEVPEFNFRLKVKAGLTGYAQVFGKYNTTPYDKLKLDITYIENYSIWLDVKLILLTIRVLFQPDGTEGIDQDQITASLNKK